MAIIGEELKGFVVNQINARQNIHGSGAGNDIANTRTDQQINLLISNTSWIKLASGVSITGAKLTEINVPSSYEGMGLAKKYILNAGFSKLEDGRLQQCEGFLPQEPNSSYTYGTYGYSPMPGIISADIKTLNRGSLKKATVRIKINNKEQFDIIDLLYLRLGFTVLLEWGNSIYTKDGITRETVRGTLVEDPDRFFNPSFGSKKSYLDILPSINSYRNKYSGNYDALLGKVSNFSWAFNPDGSYDAEITIISLGDVIESLKLNISTDKNLRNFIIESTGGTSGDNGNGNNNENNNEVVIIGSASKEKGFIEAVHALEAKIGVEKNAIIRIMKHESGLSPQARNKSTNATGLIQFMPNTAKGLGTTVDELIKMTGMEQLKYVEKYYKSMIGKAKTIGDLYMFTFIPAAKDKSNNFELGVKGSTSSVFGLNQDSLYRQNKVFDKTNKGYYTVGDVKDRINSTY